MNCHRYPLALSNQDTGSTLCKTVKSELFKILKISLGTVSVIPIIHDGMVLFQKLPATLFLIDNWSTNTIHAKILEDKELHVTIEGKAICISSNGNKLLAVLCNRLCEQKEADTKVFL